MMPHGEKVKRSTPVYYMEKIKNEMMNAKSNGETGADGQYEEGRQKRQIENNDHE
jgi:hypothetical protein